jgi:hypothetical protein
MEAKRLLPRRQRNLCHLVGAAVYSAREERAYLIQPNGQGPTDTINRAEGSAIFHVLNDICPPDEDALVFTDSQVCIQRLQKMIQHLHKLLHNDMDIHADLTRRTAELVVERAERGVATHILKVKSHTGILSSDSAMKRLTKLPKRRHSGQSSANTQHQHTALTRARHGWSTNLPQLPLTDPPNSGQLPTWGEASNKPFAPLQN